MGQTVEPRRRLVLITTVLLVVSAVTIVAIAGHVPVASAVVLVAVLPAVVSDVRCHRLPDRSVGFGLLVAVGAAAVESALGSRLDGLTISMVLLGAATMAAPILLLHLCDPAAMGFGDVKLAAVLGIALSPVGWPAAIAALAVGASSGLLIAAVIRARTVPFGAALVAGSAVVLITHSIGVGP